MTASIHWRISFSWSALRAGMFLQNGEAKVNLVQLSAIKQPDDDDDDDDAEVR